MNMFEDEDEQDYSNKENELVEAGLVQLADFEANTKKSVASNSTLVTFELGRDRDKNLRSRQSHHTRTHRRSSRLSVAQGTRKRSTR